ncbi:hypothetical protein D9M69_435790 [compost metagenome]
MAVTPLGRHVGLSALGFLGDFKNSVAILIQLLGNLAKQLGKLDGGLAQQIQVIALDRLVQALRSIANSLHSRLEYCRESKLMLSVQATDEFEHQGIELQQLIPREHAKNFGVDQRSQNILTSVSQHAWIHFTDQRQHLLRFKGWNLTRALYQPLDHRPVVIKGEHQRAWVSHVLSYSTIAFNSASRAS